MIPARRQWFTIICLCAWLGGWAYGEVLVTREFVLGRGPPLPFALIWLTAWTAGGALAVMAVAWGLAGREVVSVGSGLFAIRREVFGVGRTWEYDPAQVRNVRVAVAGFDPFDFKASFRLWGIGGGPIAFDYGARTYRVGSGIEEAEAASIVGAVRERLPPDA